MNNGLSTTMAARYTYWIVALVGLAAMAMVLTGLLGKTKSQNDEKRSVLQIAKEALQAAKSDPIISLAYGVTFAATGAITVIGTFFTLWMQTYGTTVAGLVQRRGSGQGRYDYGYHSGDGFDLLSDLWHSLR